MAFPPASTIPPSNAASPLDGPPPSPTAMSGGGNTPFSMRGAVPPLPPQEIPPEMLTGITAAFTQVTSVLDATAQALPTKAPQIGLIKDLIAQLLADVMSAGGGSISPTNPGPAAPMGGIDRGIAGPGAI
jgi:hypothetical protein